MMIDITVDHLLGWVSKITPLDSSFFLSCTVSAAGFVYGNLTCLNRHFNIFCECIRFYKKAGANTWVANIFYCSHIEGRFWGYGSL